MSTDIRTFVDAAAETLADQKMGSPNSTIVPDTNRSNAPALVAMKQVLGNDNQDSLVIESKLGEGGMGIVHLANQTSIGRTVAVKSLKSEVRSPMLELRLMREGWITGALEHPNIVPVYDIRANADSSPQIVLKRIAGTTWSELIGKSDEIRKRFKTDDPFEWHLRTFLQVCQAVHFAHTRGIVHRDLKPENIMLGEFGEVYVLDWGIAVSVMPDSDERFPLAENALQMAGTPAYMAPEMLGSRSSGAGITTQTDIYLLGSVLFEVITGRPPHSGATFTDIVMSIADNSPPPLPLSCPIELRTIIERAMMFDSATRFSSVDEMRRSIEGFLRHRGSLTLSRAALDTLADFESKAAASFSTKTLREAQLNSLREMFTEVRFGFLAALQTWADNGDAIKGMRSAFETMITFELEHGDPTAAEALCAAGEVKPELVAKAKDAAKSFRQRQSELTELEASMSQTTGKGSRMVLAVVCAMFAVDLPLVAVFLGDISHEQLMLSSLSFLVVAVIVGALGVKSLNKTHINRALFGCLLAVLTFQVGAAFFGQVTGVSVHHVMLIYAGAWTIAMAMVGFSLDHKLLPAALVYFIGFAAMAIFEEHWEWVSAISNACVFVPMALLYRPAKIISKN